MDYSYKKIWTITYPVLFSLLMQNIIGMTDTAFMGRVGEVELGASALAGIYYLVMYMIGFGFSVGAEILMGRRNGEGKFREIGRIFYHGNIILLIIAALMFTLSYLASPGLLRALISSDEVYQATLSYSNIRIYGFFFSFIAIMFRAFFMATTRTSILTYNGLVMVLCNVVLNYVLIFGKLGLPAMGIAGAALGSVLSEVVSVMFYVIYTSLRPERKYGLYKLYKWSFNIQRQVFRISSWTMIQFFVSCGTWLFFFMAIEHLGERSLAISNIVRNVSTLLYIFVSAFATTGSAMVSNLMGAGKTNEVMPLCRRIIKLCSLSTIPLLIFTAVFPSVMLRIYTNNWELIQASRPSMWVMLCSYVFSIPGYVYFLAISGTGNTKVTFWIELSILSVYFAGTYLTAIHLGTDVAVCWTVETVYGAMLLMICWLYMRSGAWKTKVL